MLDGIPPGRVAPENEIPSMITLPVGTNGLGKVAEVYSICAFLNVLNFYSPVNLSRRSSCIDSSILPDVLISSPTNWLFRM